MNKEAHPSKSEPIPDMQTIAVSSNGEEQKFLREFAKRKIRVLSPDPQAGPDGFPYLLAESDELGGEPVAHVVGWLAEHGIGLVLNPHQEYPEYVFTYGMLWNFKEHGEFLSELNGAAKTPSFGEKPALQPGQKIWTMSPNEKYLPVYVRSFLKQFLLDQAIFRPRILLISYDGQHFELAFSLESVSNLPEKDQRVLAQAMSWFLPPHYVITFVSERLVRGFADL